MTATMSVDSSGQQHFYKRKQEERSSKDDVSHRSKKRKLKQKREVREALSPEPQDKSPIEPHMESDPEEMEIPEDPTEDLDDESNKSEGEGEGDEEEKEKPEPSTKSTIKSERISELESQVTAERSARERL